MQLAPAALRLPRQISLSAPRAYPRLRLGLLGPERCVDGSPFRSYRTPVNINIWPPPGPGPLGAALARLVNATSFPNLLSALEFFPFPLGSGLVLQISAYPFAREH